jgi:hypothetical protein
VSKHVVQAGWDHAPHLSEDAKKDLLGAIPPHQREARSKGVPTLGSGAIYGVPEEDFVIPDFAPIPDHWYRSYGLDVGWNRTAAIWGAHNRDSDIVYFYSEHYAGDAIPAVHADAIKARGKWIPGVIDPAARGRSIEDGERMIELYQAAGLDVEPADNSVEAGIYEVRQRLISGKLKVFASLIHWLAEYRQYRRDEKGKIVKKKDHAMDASRYEIMSGLAREKQNLPRKPVHGGRAPIFTG